MLLRRVMPRCVVCGLGIEVSAVELVAGPDLPDDHAKQPPFFADREHLDQALSEGWRRKDSPPSSEAWLRNWH